MATHQNIKRVLAILMLLTFCALWAPTAHAQRLTPGPATTVGTFPPPAPAPLRPDAADVLLDVAAHSPRLLIVLKTQEDIINININPYVRVHMVTAIARGAWILTTSVPVTSGKWTGRPWLALGPNSRFFYFAYESAMWTGDGSDADGGDQGGVATGASGDDLADFGKEMAAIGLGIAKLGEQMGGPKGKAVQGLGLGLAGIGLAVETIGLLTKDPTPKTGHVDSDSGPTGMPAAGGPPGTDPNGPAGASPPGIGVNGNGNSPSGGISGTGGEGEGGVGDPGDD